MSLGEGVAPPRRRLVESGRGAPGRRMRGVAVVRRLSRRSGAPFLTVATFPCPRSSNRTSSRTCDFPASGFPTGHALSNGRLPVVGARCSRRWVSHSLLSRWRTYRPAFTLCFRQSHCRSHLVVCAAVAGWAGQLSEVKVVRPAGQHPVGRPAKSSNVINRCFTAVCPLTLRRMLPPLALPGCVPSCENTVAACFWFSGPDPLTMGGEMCQVPQT